MEKIKFKLFGSTWTMKKVNKALVNDGQWAFGFTDAGNRTIEVSTIDDKDKKISNQEVRLTMLHEIVHSILETGQYHQTNMDEPQVEWIARCLLSLIDQGILKKFVVYGERHKADRSSKS